MRFFTLYKMPIILIAIMYFIGLSLPTYATTIDKIIVFGDSTSDNGNLYAFTSKLKETVPTLAVIPLTPPYYQGRFSNGPVWAEDLAAAMQVPLEDYAYGGAWAETYNDANKLMPFALNLQVDLYFAESRVDLHRSQHLYVIWIGANDYLNGRTNIDAATTDVVSEIQHELQLLTHKGAMNIVIAEQPNLSRLPGVIDLGPDIVAQVASLVKQHNQKLMTMIASEKASNPKVNYITVDLTDLLNNMNDHPENYHLTNSTEPCYSGRYYLQSSLASSAEVEASKENHLDLMNNFELKEAYLLGKLALTVQPCRDQDDYMFWDHVHPTRVVHQLIASSVLNILSSHGIETAIKKG